MKISQILIRDLRILSSLIIGKFFRRDPNLWVFGEWFGKRCCDNSLYLANYVSEHYPDIRAVWIHREGTDLSLLHPDIERIEMDSAAAIRCLKHAAVAIMNEGFVDFSEKQKFYFGSAVTVNLWHGVPWKRIFNDSVLSKNNIKNFHTGLMNAVCKAKIFLANSSEFRRILINSNNLESSQIIMAGYPRNSLFYSENLIEKARQKTVEMIRDQGIACSMETKIITYMPTFRDKTHDIFSFVQLSTDEKFNSILEKENAILVQKGHFITSERGGIPNKNLNTRIIELDHISAQELLAATDLLVTDYSSCFFDFLLLDRPIIHYLYDYDYYANIDRGLYYRKEDVACGDCAMTVDNLIDSIDNNLKDPNKNSELRQQRIQQYLDCEASGSCEVIVNAIRKELKK